MKKKFIRVEKTVKIADLIPDMFAARDPQVFNLKAEYDRDPNATRKIVILEELDEAAVEAARIEAVKRRAKRYEAERQLRNKEFLT